MGQKKLQRFADIKTFANVLEYPQDMTGKWRAFFKNENDVILELACGRGEYTVGLAQLHPGINYIGVDIKGNRLWKGAADALRLQLPNVAFLRTQIELIPAYFGKEEVSEIWITFPDPQLRVSKQKRRLVHPRFLRLYQSILSPQGCIHVKTDSPALYHFTKKIIEVYHFTLLHDQDDVYGAVQVAPELAIKTHYEKLDIAQSNRIFYLCFRLDADLTDDKEEFFKQWENEKMFDDDESYTSQNELVIFTSEYLLQRGYCCGNGCKNCPFDYKAVPEPRRSLLLKSRKENPSQ